MQNEPVGERFRLHARLFFGKIYIRQSLPGPSLGVAVHTGDACPVKLCVVLPAPRTLLNLCAPCAVHAAKIAHDRTSTRTTHTAAVQYVCVCVWNSQLTWASRAAGAIPQACRLPGRSSRRSAPPRQLLHCAREAPACSAAQPERTRPHR